MACKYIYKGTTYNTREEFLEYAKENIIKESSENKFMQLLEKDSNWVTFFIKTIIQDSIKKGYEKVLFPKGETAAKVEGHETIAEEIRKIDNELKNNKDFLESPTNLYEVTPFDSNYTDAILEDGLENKIKKAEKNIIKLERQKQELKSQGIEKLKPIEAFYEIKVGNILEKQFGKDNVKTITDEYGNRWREIDLSNTNVQKVVSPILLSINDKNNKYFRATNPSNETSRTFTPRSYYEKVEIDNNGNPYIKLNNNLISDAEQSNIPEIAASQTIRGAIYGAYTGTGNKSFDMYSIDNVPDVNLSDVKQLDFDLLSEVRYRQSIGARKIGSITLSETEMNVFSKMQSIRNKRISTEQEVEYFKNNNVIDEETGETITPPNTENIKQRESEIKEDFDKVLNNIVSRFQVGKFESENKELYDKIVKFLDKLGFKIDTVSQITDINGNPIGAVAMVDMLNKIVSVAEGKSDISDLTEEAIHVFVRLLKLSNDPIYKEMLDQIESLDEYKEVLDMYSDIGGYNDSLLREEAIGKVIKNIIINRKHEQEVSPVVYRNWFDKLIAWFKNLGSKVKSDPFVSAARIFMNEDYDALIYDMGDSKMYSATPKTREDTIKLLDKVNTDLEKRTINVKEFVSKGYKGVGETIERYYDKSTGKIITHRITDKAQQIRESNRTKESIRKSQETAYSIMAKDMGTKLHSVMEELVPAVLNKQSLNSIKTKSKLNDKDFNKLVQFAKYTISEFNKIQDRIDPNSKIEWRVEQKIYSPIDDEGGTIDLLAIYSDNTASIVEYKFKQASRYNSVVDPISGQRVLTKDVVDDPSEFAGDIQISRQKNILASNFGITTLRTSRLVPFAITVPFNAETQKYEDRVLELFSPLDGSEYLQEISLANESTGLKHVDDKLERGYKLLDTLITLRQKSTIPANREKLSLDIRNLRQALQKIHREYDISLILDLAYSTAAPLFGDAKKTKGKQIQENEPYIDGVKNPKYMDMNDLLELKDRLIAYQEMLSNSYGYVLDVSDGVKLDQAKLKSIKARIGNTNEAISNGIGVIEDKIEERLISGAKEIDNIQLNRPTHRLTWWEMNMHVLSEIDHPVYEYAKNLIFNAEAYTRSQTLKTYDEIKKLEEDLFKYADSIGVNHLKIFDKFVEEDGFRIKSMYKESLFHKDLPNARDTGNIAWIKERFNITDKYIESYPERLEKKKISVNDLYPDIVIDVDNVVDKSKERSIMLQNWIDRNDYRLDGFWLNKEQQRNLRLKENYQNQYLSDSYKEISSIPALKAFYDYMVNKNIEFGEIVGPGKISLNFLPKIRRTLVDEIVQHSGGIFAGMKEARQLFVDSHKYRQDGVMGQYDPTTGELKDSVPLLYTNPFRNSLGEIVHEQNSRDLGKNLMMFAESVYNFEGKTAIESTVLALEDYLRSNSNGEIKRSETDLPEKDVKGNVIKDKSQSKSLNNFKKLMKYYIYGQKLQDDKVIKLFGSEMSRNALVRSVMQFHRMKTLGFAIIPPLAARVAGEGSIYFEGAKGRFYDRKDIVKAHEWFWSNKKEYQIAVRFFNIYQEDRSFKLAHSLSANILSKRVTLDNLYKGYSFADEKIDNTVLVAMLNSHGIDSQGNTYKLSEQDKTSGKKSLLELMSIKDDKVVIDGMTEISYQQFRQKARTATRSIKGQMSPEDINAVNTSLIGQMAMMYRNWMPGVVNERFGRFRYNPATKQFEQGRYRVFLGSVFNEQATLMTVLSNLGHTGLRMIGAMDNFSKYKLGVPGSSSYERAKRFVENEYNKFKQEFDGDIRFQENFSLDDFIELRAGQTRAFIVEARTICLVLLAMLAGKMDWDDDGQVEWKDIWLTRKLFQVLNRSQSEWSFVWNPSEWKNFFSSPFALTGVFSDIINITTNTFDETKDYLYGENANNDKTPWFYYSSKLFPGFKNFQGLLEWYKQDELKTR